MTTMLLAYIKDTATDSAGPVLSFMTKQQAVRTLHEAANSKENNIGKYPNDYIMYQCGSYDNDTGIITISEHELIARAADLVEGDKK